MEKTNWYKNAVIYQIYPRSFCDSNGDGMGDIKGITSKLDHLSDLGVNAVWLSPVYDSPQEDNGYDIKNYYDIYPPFGTLEDFKEMLSEMHKRGIRLIMDLVVNHTSSEHPWFQSILKDKNSPYRDYYIIKKGKNGGKKPPTNWTGFFGGSTWERIGNTDEYYLHLFAKGQPDLNWENPKVRDEVVKILRYWLDMGVDGFRCDVITLISKKQSFRSSFPSPALTGMNNYVNGPRLHEFLREINERALKDYDCMTVGETVLTSLDDVINLTSPNRKELDMVFNFSHTDSDNFFGVKMLYRPFKLKRFKRRLSKFQYGLEDDKGWNSLFIENHDQRRSVGRFGTSLDEKYKLLSQKMLATCYFNLCGTPFIYEGQEIGMENLDYESIDDFMDVEIKNTYRMTEESIFYRILIAKHLFETSRDNARTPMQWDNSKYAGFSTVKPWLKVNGNKDRVNAENAKADPNSIYNYYKALINLRKNEDVIINGKYRLLEKNHKDLYIYERESDDKIALVICNFSTKEYRNPVSMGGFNLVLSNYDDESDILRPYDARVYLKRK